MAALAIALVALVVALWSAWLAWRKSYREVRPDIGADPIRCSPRLNSQESAGFWDEPCFRFVNRGPLDYSSVLVEVISSGASEWKPVLAFKLDGGGWEHRLKLGAMSVGARRVAQIQPGPAQHGGKVSLRVECRGRRWRWWWQETWLTAIEVEPLPGTPKVTIIE